MSDVADLTTIGSTQITTATAATALTSVTLGNGLAGVSGSSALPAPAARRSTPTSSRRPTAAPPGSMSTTRTSRPPARRSFSLVQGAGANLALTDGALANNTALNSGVVPLFDDFRLKWSSVGTWVAGTLVAYAMPRG
jgi:hypothetical protein